MENCYFTIGREGQICLQDRAVSKQHAEIQVVNGEIYLRDLGSTNGTFLVKNHRLVPFVEGYVQLNQVVAFGNGQYSVRELLDRAGAHDLYAQDGTTRLGSRANRYYLSTPGHQASHSHWTH